jgi:hypothetical protein
VWIISRLNAFGLTFLAGLFLGFGLGVHAIRADIGPWVFGALAVAALVGSLRDGRLRTSRPPTPTPAILPAPKTDSPNSHAITDARDTLAALGFSQRDAQASVARAVSALGVNADVSALVREVLRKERS